MPYIFKIKEHGYIGYNSQYKFITQANLMFSKSYPTTG